MASIAEDRPATLDITGVTVPAEAGRYRRRDRLETSLTYLALAIGASVMAFPLVWMGLSSLKAPAEVIQFPPTWWPETIRWSNYRDAWTGAPFGRFFFNSLFISLSAAVGTVVTSLMAGYALSHIPFRGRQIGFGLLLATMAIPNEVTIVPAFLIMRTLGWVDTYLALIVPALASVFGIFLMRQALSQMPRDLLEAAQLDGCGHLRYLFGIVVPLNWAAISSLALLTFLGQWNAYLWPLLVTNRTELRTVQLGIRFFVDSEQGNQWGALMAASTFVILPTLIVFLVAQRYLVRGFAFSGLKG